MIQGMRQSMAATPAMQMMLHALQANQTELEEIINKALAANPALEKAEPAPSKDPVDYRATQHRDFAMQSISSTQTLAEFLEEQIRQNDLSPKVKQAALQIIPYLNEHGFFAEPLSIVQQELGLDEKLFQQARRAICDADPAGVGAVDIRESLILQLKRLGEHKGLPMQLLKNHWDALIRHRYADIADALDIDEEAAELAARRIARLNPDPGSGFSQAELNVISPDILVEEDAGELKVSLTQEASPQLVLSAEYREMMAEHADKAEVRQFLSKCFREGRELIRALSDRNTTLLSVAEAIVRIQHHFFRVKNAVLIPMRLEDVAGATGLHVSTVSRAVRGKYLQCRRGVFELKALFTTGINDVSADAIKQKIRALIAAEDAEQPLSDAEIEAQLSAEGINIARRTIAKYRDAMKILPASLRKHH